MDDRHLQALRQEWIVTAGVFGLLVAIGLVVSFRLPDQQDTGVLLGIAALGVLLFKLGDLLLVAIGELRRRDRD